MTVNSVPDIERNLRPKYKTVNGADASAARKPSVQTADLETLCAWLTQESPTSDAASVNAMADLVVAQAQGLSVERITGPDGIGDMLVLRGGPHNSRKGALVIAHLDTVHPLGTIETALPVRLAGDRLHGPGVYDMKAGALMGLRAVQDAIARGACGRPVTFLFAPDEEIGSPFSRAITERLARDAEYALVLEPAREGGACVTARKGVGRMEIEVEGVAAHSGVRHRDGRSAIVEAAHQVIAIEAMTDYEKNITTTVGKIAGGTAVNTVPQFCKFSVDFRAPTLPDCDHVLQRIQQLQPATPGTRLRISGGIKRPPFERTAGNVALLHKVQAAAQALGFDIAEAPMTGGGSDGNFTSSLGVPTLDGIGIEGAGAHTLQEYALVSSFEPRRALIARVLESC
jgi:glutamate carboxypeptidase